MRTEHKRKQRKIERFEDLIAWQKARGLTRAVYGVTKEGAFARDRDLSRQIQRASVSVMSKLAEGFERGRRAEFHQFVSVAKASGAEVRSQLYVAHDIGYLSQDSFDNLLSQAEERSRILGGLRAALEKQKNAPSQSSLRGASRTVLSPQSLPS